MNEISPQEIDFTDKQMKAISTQGSNLCVAAGAGSGKTTVLVERYLYLIEKAGMDISDIVAITFTEKAANQMKEKIRKKMHDKATGTGKTEDQEEWARRYRDIGSAWIHTIHGLCSRLLRENAIEAGMDPSFTTLDETETVLLIHRTIRDFLNQRLNKGEPSTVKLLTGYGLKGTVEILTQFLQQRDKISAWLHHYLGRPAEEILRPLRKEAEEKMGAMVHRLQEISCPNQQDKMEQIRQQALTLFAGTRLSKDNLETFASLRLQGGSKKSWGEEGLDRIKERLKRLKDLAKRLVPLYHDERLHHEHDLVRAMLTEADALNRQYAAEKASQGMVDFDDLLILARDLLKNNPDITDRYRNERKALLIDELQDTDPLQMEIVWLLSEEAAGQLFAVGDEKQSIYSFRGADVTEFLKYREAIRTSDPEAVIPLQRNFRSQEEILNFINHLFSRIFPQSSNDPDLLFPHLEPHKKSLNTTHFVESCFIPKTKNEGQSTAVLREQEAQWIASRIYVMVEGREERILAEENRARAVEYRDIALLFRAMTDVKVYESALRQLGIPFTVISGAGFFDKQEVLDVLNLLKILLYPQDEEALAGILRSPIAGLRDDTLFFMTRDRTLSQALSEAESIGAIDDSQRRLLIRAREMIRDLRRLRDRVRVPRLIGRFLESTGYPALLLTDPVHGEQRYANLRKFMDLAREFSAKQCFGLSDFIDYIQELKAREAREGESPIHEESQDTVRLLTVHKAKGLEFPVVFLPDLSRTRSGKRNPVEIHPELGIGIPVPDKRGSSQNSYTRSLILEQNKIKEIDDEKRLFYVAVTRAQDFLVLSGQVRDRANPRPDSSIPMDWLQDILNITEANCRSDIPYGERKIRTSSPQWVTAEQDKAEPTWIQEYPGILEGHPLEVTEDPTARALIDRVNRIPKPQAPRRFSVSQLLTYRRCPKRYELSRFHGIAEPPREHRRRGSAGGRELGNLVHAVLQNWDFDLSGLKDCFERELRRSALGPDEDQKVLTQALRLLQRFAESPTAEEIRKGNEVYSEVPFILKLEDSQIEGIIDKLYRNRSGRLTVIDYKTDPVLKEDVPKKAEEYRPQLETYALASHRLFGEEIETALVFLAPGITYPLQIDPEVTQAEILSVIREIQRAPSFGKNRERCPTCGYWEPFCSLSSETL